MCAVESEDGYNIDGVTKELRLPTPEVGEHTDEILVFIGREAECGPDAKELGELGPIVHLVGWYVLDRRFQLQGGETVGTSEDPVGRIHLNWSRLSVDRRQVYRIELMQAHAKADNMDTATERRS
jgi:hypothetical protein